LLCEEEKKISIYFSFQRPIVGDLLLCIPPFSKRFTAAIPHFFPLFTKKKEIFCLLLPESTSQQLSCRPFFLKISFETYIMPSAPIEDRINGELLIITSQKKIQ